LPFEEQFQQAPFGAAPHSPEIHELPFILAGGLGVGPLVRGHLASARQFHAKADTPVGLSNGAGFGVDPGLPCRWLYEQITNGFNRNIHGANPFDEFELDCVIIKGKLRLDYRDEVGRAFIPGIDHFQGVCQRDALVGVAQAHFDRYRILQSDHLRKGQAVAQGKGHRAVAGYFLCIKYTPGPEKHVCPGLKQLRPADFDHTFQRVECQAHRGRDQSGNMGDGINVT